MTNLTLAITAIPPSTPRKMVEDTNFTLTYDEATGLCTFTLVLAPTSTDPIVDYAISIIGVAAPVILTGSGTFAFNPTLYPAIWEWGVASWTAAFQVAARSEAYGLGAKSDAVDVTIDQDATYFIGAWTYEEERDAVDAGGVPGRQNITTPVYIAPTGFVLYSYSGALAYTSDNFTVIHAAAVAHASNTMRRTTTGVSVGSTANGILLWQETDGSWHPASAQKQFVAQGIIAVALPAFTVQPATSGATTIGSLRTGSHTSTGDTSVARQWLRSGVAIAGATGATYTLVAADDLANISYRVTLTNASGSVVATSPAVQARYAAPGTTGTLSDLVINEEDGATASFAAAAVFTGSALTYAVSGASGVVSINASTGFGAILLTDALALTEITVTASNSGGSATQTFDLTITATPPPGITWPADITQGGIVVTEVTDPDVATAQGFAGESGHLKMVVGAITVAPAGFTLRRLLLDGAVGNPDPTNTAITASTTVYTNPGALAVGATAYPRAYWLHTASGQMKLAWSEVPFDIVGLDDPQPTSWPAISGVSAASGDARSKPFLDFNTTGAGLSNVYAAMSMSAAAYASWQGDTSCDAYTISAIKSNLSGANDPSMQMGYAAQYELIFMTAVFFASRTPRIWTPTGTANFSAVEKTRIDLLMKAGGIAAAAITRESGENQKNMLGFNNSSNSGSNPNIRSGSRACVMVFCAYMGGAAAGKAYLDSVTTGVLNTLAADLLSNGLSNCRAAFNPTRPTGAPSFAFIAGKCTNWTTFGDSILDPRSITLREVNYCYDKPVTTGYNNGAGVPGSGPPLRGKLMSSVTSYAPYQAIAGMIGRGHEFESVDGGGVRSSASYSMLAERVETMMFLVTLASGMLDPADAVVKASAERLRVGTAYRRVCTAIGYLSIAMITAGGANSENWTDASRTSQWGLSYTLSMMDVVVDVVEAA